MVNDAEQGRYCPPTIDVDHGNLIEEEHLHCCQVARNLIFQLRQVAPRFEFRIQIEEVVDGRGHDRGARHFDICCRDARGRARLEGFLVQQTP